MELLRCSSNGKPFERGDCTAIDVDVALVDFRLASVDGSSSDAEAAGDDGDDADHGVHAGLSPFQVLIRPSTPPAVHIPSTHLSWPRL